MIQPMLQEILRLGGMPVSLADHAHFTGGDPVFQTPFRIAVTGAAALGAVGLMLAQLRELQSGARSDVLVDARSAAVSMRSTYYILVDGKPGRNPPESVGGFYRTASGRMIYFHCNFPWHQEAILRVLKVPADCAKVAEAVSRWDCFELEAAVEEAGACAPVVRTREEWAALPNTATLAREPLVEIRKIGDSKPMALAPEGRPLSGMRVLDFTRVIAGPSCCRLLAEYGADVLKIGSKRRPDSAANETDTAYGKRKAILDLRSPDGRAQLDELVRRCDVFCQAYRRGAMSGLGFSPERVAELRPGIVYTSLTAFGYTGPWAGHRGFDTVVQPASGMAMLQGGSLDTPELTPVSALDYLAGYLMTFGTLVALKRRAEFGGSYSVNVSLARVCEWLLSQGLIPADQVKATPKDLRGDELAPMLVTVPSPLGQLTRMRPVIRFSDGAYSDLPPWRAFHVPRAVWSSAAPVC